MVQFPVAESSPQEFTRPWRGPEQRGRSGFLVGVGLAPKEGLEGVVGRVGWARDGVDWAGVVVVGRAGWIDGGAGSVGWIEVGWAWGRVSAEKY